MLAEVFCTHFSLYGQMGNILGTLSRVLGGLWWIWACNSTFLDTQGKCYVLAKVFSKHLPLYGITGNILGTRGGFGHEFPPLWSHGAHHRQPRRIWECIFPFAGTWGTYYVLVENSGTHFPLWGITGHIFGTRRDFGDLFSPLWSHGAHDR